jgi:hypothetical protein
VADELEASMLYQQKRGQGTPNPIKSAKLKIRLVYPPYLTNAITERPAKNMEYRLRINAKKPYELKGKTDGQGLLEQEVPATAKSGTLTLYVDADGKTTEFWTIRIAIGDLEDTETIKGEQARLDNLGLFATAGKNLKEPMGHRMLRARSRFLGLYAGPNDEWTAAKLKEVYGG